MNKEIIKAMNRKSKKSTFRKWWNKNGYKVMRVILFPIWIGEVIVEKIKKALNARQVWSEERADKILSYYIPRHAEWIAEEKCFYFADNGRGWGAKCYQQPLTLQDRVWWKTYTAGWGGKVRTYLIEKFELEGFEKIVEDTFDSWTEITFKLSEK